MKKLLLFLGIVLFSVVAIGQTIDLDKQAPPGDSTWTSIDTDTLYLAKDSIYITATEDSLLLVSDTVWVKGNLFVKDSLVLPGLATSETKVLSPTSTGGTTSLETVDGTTITYDTLSFDFGDVTNDLDVGDTIEFDNGAKIYNPHADTVYIDETVVTINGILAATGNISGTTDLTLDIAATIVLTTADCRNKVRFNNDADVIDYTLPGAEAGLVIVFYDIGGGVITIDPVDGTDTIYLNGTSVGAGDAIDSPGSVGDFICLMAIDDTRWVTVGRSGTFVDGGAD